RARRGSRMDPATHVRARPPADGLVSTAASPRSAIDSGRLAMPIAVRGIMALAVAALLAGIVGGLLRAGTLDVALAGTAPFGDAVVAHASLMICAFFGAVIGIERAVALKRTWAFLAPVLAGAGGVA